VVKRLFAYLIVGGLLALPASAAANTDFLPPISPATAAARTHYVAYAPSAVIGKVPTAASSNGFDWGDAAIGAAIALGACGLAAAVVSRRRPGREPRAG
jgi:hypothetical protein